MKAQVRARRGDGTTEVGVGDSVGFKCDIEQTGRIVAIKTASWGQRHVELTLESDDGFSGEYIGGQRQTTERASDCWAL